MSRAKQEYFLESWRDKAQILFEQSVEERAHYIQRIEELTESLQQELEKNSRLWKALEDSETQLKDRDKQIEELQKRIETLEKDNDELYAELVELKYPE